MWLSSSLGAEENECTGVVLIELSLYLSSVSQLAENSPLRVGYKDRKVLIWVSCTKPHLAVLF